MNNITITWSRISVDREGNPSYFCRIIKDGKEVLSAQFMPHARDTMAKIVKHLRFLGLISEC